jgi:hypothetical protein
MIAERLTTDEKVEESADFREFLDLRFEDFRSEQWEYLGILFCSFSFDDEPGN